MSIGQHGDTLKPLHSIPPIKWHGQPIPERQWLVENWIPWGCVTALYGDGGTGKSLLAQQLLTSVATGTPFLGLPVRQCKCWGCSARTMKTSCIVGRRPSMLSTGLSSATWRI